MYIAVSAGLAITTLSLIHVIMGMHRRATWRSLTLFTLVVATVGAIKLLPTLEFLSGLTGQLGQSNGIPIRHLLEVLTIRTAESYYTRPWTTMPWYEYTAYVGPLALVLAIVGLVIAIRQRRRSLVALALVGIAALLLATTSANHNPLEHLPILNQLRNPSRYIIIALLSLATLAGFAADSLVKRLSPLLGHSLIMIAAMLIFMDTAAIASPVLSQTYSLKPTSLDTRQPNFFQEQANRGAAYHVVEAGIGARNYCPAHLSIYQSNALIYAQSDEQYRGESYAIGDSDVSLAALTPNKLSIEIGHIPDGGDTLIVNQKFTPGWRSKDQLAFSDQSRIALSIREEDANTTITLRFLPTSFIIGATISTLSILFISSLWAISHHRKKLSITSTHSR